VTARDHDPRPEDASASDVPSPPAPVAALPRRDFLRSAGALGAGALLGGALPSIAHGAPALHLPPHAVRRGSAGHVVVIGAGIWGSFTALNLVERGERVTLIDAYGPGNSRATSGDETRGIRSSYGDRGDSGELWTRWAREAISRWTAFDAEYGPQFGTRFFMKTGDVIMRARDETFLQRTREHWTTLKVPFEALDGDEVRKRWPIFRADDITVGVYEPDAGVARARASNQAVAAIAARKGATLVTGRATPGPIVSGRMQYVQLDDGTRITGDAYVFCCGPWFRKVFPDIMANRMRIPLGTACYYGTPEGDSRFSFPNMPSYNFTGTTGWPALPVDNRGFRVRGGMAPPPPPANAVREKLPEPPPPPAPDPANQDPDTSIRWAGEDRIAGARRFIAFRFPALANAPLLETRTCHYESSINRNFIIDHVPESTNAWLAGVGQAEGFKFAPVTGEYVSKRVLGDAGDPALVKAFALPTAEYESAGTTPRGNGFEDDE
jgi:glycine/D-amino acid oxidase-like deaminating enzyme